MSGRDFYDRTISEKQEQGKQIKQMNYDDIDLDFDGGSSVNLERMDDYLEMLYSQDDFLTKVKGSFLIMQLSRIPDNLEFLITNGTYWLIL